MNQSINQSTGFCLPAPGTPRPAEVVPVEEGVFQATYMPAAEGKCKVDVQYGGAEVPNRSVLLHDL